MIFLVDDDVPVRVVLELSAGQSHLPDDEYFVLGSSDILGYTTRQAVEGSAEADVAVAGRPIGELDLEPLRIRANIALEQIAVSSDAQLLVVGPNGTAADTIDALDHGSFTEAIGSVSAHGRLRQTRAFGIAVVLHGPTTIRHCSTCASYVTMPPLPPEPCKHPKHCEFAG